MLSYTDKWQGYRRLLWQIAYRRRILRNPIRWWGKLCHKVIDKTCVDDNKAFFVISKNEDAYKKYALHKVYLLDDKFIYENIGQCFDEQEARKNLAKNQGLEWNGTDTIDDFFKFWSCRMLSFLTFFIRLTCKYRILVIECNQVIAYLCTKGIWTLWKVLDRWSKVRGVKSYRTETTK